jgi:hypothetical protein
MVLFEAKHMFSVSLWSFSLNIIECIIQRLSKCVMQIPGGNILATAKADISFEKDLFEAVKGMRATVSGLSIILCKLIYKELPRGGVGLLA